MRTPEPDARRRGFRLRRDHASGLPAIDWTGAEPRPKPPDPGGGPPWQDPVVDPVYCPDCEINRLESAAILQDQYTSTMVVPSFFDSTGRFHVHDSNLRTKWYACTRGHNWATQEFIVCPCTTCIWPEVV